MPTPLSSADTSADVENQPVIDLVPAVIHLKTILVPTDFSPSSKKALSYAVAFARQFGGAIRLVHVVEPIPPYPVDGLSYPIGDLTGANGELTSEAHKAIHKLRESVATDTTLDVTSEVRLGRAYDEIVQAARTAAVDLIVIATHGLTGLKHVLLGSTAERVVRHAPCPVLVVREREHEFIENA